MNQSSHPWAFAFASLPCLADQRYRHGREGGVPAWPSNFTIGTASHGQDTYFAYGSGCSNSIAEQTGGVRPAAE